MSPAAKKPALGYARVSTAEQASGFGLDTQDEAIQRFARSNNLRLVEVLREEGVSGSNGLEDRPALSQAFARCESGEAEFLVVWKLDRLARDLVKQETWLERLRDRGVGVLSVTEPDLDGDDKTRTLVRQILGAINEYERRVIVERMQGGRATKAARGGYAYGAPPYGWRSEEGVLVPVPEEQEAIKHARKLRGEGASLREIAQALDSEGHKPRRAESWSAETVRNILRRKDPTRVSDRRR